jgi:hypothetical protein
MVVTTNMGSVVITAGHAIYRDGIWHGGFKGEDSFYARHVEAGIRLMEEGKFDCWIPSGAATRPAFETETGGISEAEGMKNYAVEHRLCSENDERILLEPWARDSMENLFFGILAYRRKTGQWPNRVGVVSWNSKALRYHLIASGMRLGGRIFFHGEGEYPSQTDLERACAAEARFNSVIVDVNCVPPAYRLIDPLLRNVREFAQKRWARMPRSFSADAAGNKAYMEQVKSAYAANDDAIAALIDRIESLEPGEGWRDIRWPWALH